MTTYCDCCIKLMPLGTRHYIGAIGYCLECKKKIEARLVEIKASAEQDEVLREALTCYEQWSNLDES